MGSTASFDWGCIIIGLGSVKLLSTPRFSSLEILCQHNTMCSQKGKATLTLEYLAATIVMSTINFSGCVYNLQHFIILVGNSD